LEFLIEVLLFAGVNINTSIGPPFSQKLPTNLSKAHETLQNNNN
jgi:hypothetical protein